MRGTGEGQAAVVVRRAAGGGAWRVREWRVVAAGETGPLVRVASVEARDGRPLLVWTGTGAATSCVLGGAALGSRGEAAPALQGSAGDEGWALALARRLAAAAARPVWLLSGQAPAPQQRPALERALFQALFPGSDQRSTPHSQPHTAHGDSDNAHTGH